MKLYNHQGWAAVLSFLLPGLGQVYNGKAPSAFIFFAIHCGLIYGIIYTFITTRTSGTNYQPLVFFGLCIIANAAYSANMAYEQALHHNALIENETEDA